MGGGITAWIKVFCTEKPKFPSVEGVNGGNCQDRSSNQLAMQRSGFEPVAEPHNSIPSTGPVEMTSLLLTTAAFVDVNGLGSPPFKSSTGRAWTFRLVAPKSLGKDWACREVGEGVAGKGVHAGVGIRSGCEEVHGGEAGSDDPWDDFSDKISSMHKGRTKLARCCKRLLLPL